jgi:hypothetical protein
MKLEEESDLNDHKRNVEIDFLMISKLLKRANDSKINHTSSQ